MNRFDNYSDFMDWAYENGYDPCNILDKEYEPYKRDVAVTGYVYNGTTQTYALISFIKSDVYGWIDFEVLEENLTKTEETVIVTKAIYK